MKYNNVNRAAPQRIFISGSGQIRAVWAILAGFVGFSAVSVGFPYLYWAGYYALLGSWGVNARNITQAPEWVIRCIEAAPAVLAAVQNTLAVAVVAVCLRGFVKKQLERDKTRDILRKFSQCAFGALISFTCILTCSALLLLTDSSRLGWRLTEPRFALIHVWTAVYIASSVIGGEVFMRMYIIETLEGRVHKGWVYSFSIVFFVLLYGLDNPSPLSLINWALMGAILYAMYYKTSHIWVGVGFRFMWSVMIYIVAGFPEAGGGGIYEVYAASRYWLNGGDTGLMNGLISTVMLSGVCLFLIRPWGQLPSLRAPYRTPPRSAGPVGASGSARRPTHRK